MENSPFYRIPGELRNRIYELALYEPDGIPVTITADRETTSGPEGAPVTTYNGKIVAAYRNRLGGIPTSFETYPDYDRHTPTVLGLPNTCRAIRAETYKMYFAINKLVIFPLEILQPADDADTYPVAQVLEHWTNRVGIHNTGAFLELRIEVGLRDVQQCDSGMWLGNCITNLISDLKKTFHNATFSVVLDKWRTCLGPACFGADRGIRSITPTVIDFAELSSAKRRFAKIVAQRKEQMYPRRYNILFDLVARRRGSAA